MLGHGFSHSKNPILKPLNTIEQRDAIINPDGTEPVWPAADVIVGNPPFLGSQHLIAGLGDQYMTDLRGLYSGRLGGGVDLVVYWFEKARAQLEAGAVRYAGLVSTQAIRRGRNRVVLERIAETGTLSGDPWPSPRAPRRAIVGYTCIAVVQI